jgi:hypothetical protein
LIFVLYSPIVRLYFAYEKAGLGCEMGIEWG